MGFPRVADPRRAGMISVEIPFLKEQADTWRKRAPAAFDRGLEAGIRAATIDVSSRVKYLLSGPVLNRRTHRLWRSIQPEVFRRMGRVVGIVGTDVEYAAVHEFGATIRPKAAGGMLAFTVDGKFRLVKSVEIPKRPYMSRAFLERKAVVNKLIRDHVVRSVRGQLKSNPAAVLPPSLRRGVGFNAQ